jgi:predicted RNA-binding Zn-ribbon protein involved in translation (DUF1610 family)
VAAARRPEARRQLTRVADSAAPTACLNCGAALVVPPPNFCPDCGQETTIRPPTLREFAQQFGGAYFSTEGALWRTLALLLLQPGELTRRYLAGRRKHYVLPLRLYLTISVVALLALRLMVALQPGIDASQVKLAEDGPPSLDLDFGVARVAVEKGVFVCDGLPPWLCARLQKRAVLDPQAVVEDVRLVRERLAANGGAAMFVLMPTFAFGLWLLYRDRRMRYTEHLVFALHLHAFWFIAIAVLQVNFTPLEIAALLAIPAYAVLAMRRVYGGGWAGLALRAVVLAMVYATLVGLAIVTVGLVALLA